MTLDRLDATLADPRRSGYYGMYLSSASETRATPDSDIEAEKRERS